jgi:uncharacterized protein YgiM (DUF1202 family)
VNRDHYTNKIRKIDEDYRRFRRVVDWAITVLALATVIITLVLLLAGCTPAVEAAPGAPAATEQPAQEPTAEPTPTRVIAPTATKSTCTVRTGYGVGTVYVRSGPGMSYPVVDVAHEGDELTTIGPVMKGWQAVTTPQLVDGWFYVQKWCEKGR